MPTAPPRPTRSRSGTCRPRRRTGIGGQAADHETRARRRGPRAGPGASSRARRTPATASPPPATTLAPCPIRPSARPRPRPPRLLPAGDAPRPGFRLERDPLGPLEVPEDAYWGVQTQRAIRNFPISGRRPDVALVRAAVQVKKAAARANHATGRLRGPPLRGDRPGRRRGPRPRARRGLPGGAGAPGPTDRQLPRRPVPGRRRRQPQHERQRGAGQPGHRAAAREGHRQRAGAATTPWSAPTTTSTWPSPPTTSSRRRCASPRST